MSVHVFFQHGALDVSLLWFSQFGTEQLLRLVVNKTNSVKEFYVEIDDPQIGQAFKFTYQVRLGGENIVAEGIRKSKKEAKKAAAEELCANPLFQKELAALPPATRHQNHVTWVASQKAACGRPLDDGSKLERKKPRRGHDQ